MEMKITCYKWNPYRIQACCEGAVEGISYQTQFLQIWLPFLYSIRIFVSSPKAAAKSQ